jgi:hypothetical protein
VDDGYEQRLHEIAVCSVSECSDATQYRVLQMVGARCTWEMEQALKIGACPYYCHNPIRNNDHNSAIKNEAFSYLGVDVCDADGVPRHRKPASRKDRRIPTLMCFNLQKHIHTATIYKSKPASMANCDACGSAITMCTTTHQQNRDQKSRQRKSIVAQANTLKLFMLPHTQQ